MKQPIDMTPWIVFQATAKDISLIIRLQVDKTSKIRRGKETPEIITLKKLTVQLCEYFTSKDESFNKSNFYCDRGF